MRPHEFDASDAARRRCVRVSSYVIGSPLSDDRFCILMHGLNGSLDKVGATTGAYLVDNRGQDVRCPPWSAGDRTENHLLTRGYLTELSEDAERALMIEVATAIHESDLASSEPSFVFIPAYTCNLRCPYCFQSHDMHAGRGAYATVLSEERIDDAFRVIDHVQQQGSLARQLSMLPDDGTVASHAHKSVKRIGLFGGEPLTALTRPVVELIVDRARRRGATIWAITNGVELDAFSELLGKDGISELQITLDGMPDIHDRRRIGPGIRRSFDRIVSNIDLALLAGARVNARINVDSSNIEHVELLNDFFALRGWSEQPSFYANAAVVTGESTHESLVSHADLMSVTGSLATACLSSYEGYAADVLNRALSDGYPFQRVAHCSAETGMVMFDPHGDVYACWEEIGSKERRIGQYHGGVLKLEDEAARAWLSRFPGAIEQCSRCPYALIHTSGCANHARAANDTIFAAACEGFQAYFPRSLADQYSAIEATALGQPSPRPPRVRQLPIVEVNGARNRTMAKELT
jgi:uncharacterized protein